MENHEIVEARTLLTELSEYNIPYIAPKAQRVLNIMKDFFDRNDEQQKREKRNIKYSRKNFNAIRELTLLNSTFGALETLRRESYDEVGICDRTQNDLLHAIEFLTPNEEEKLLGLSKDLKEIREMRRSAKDFNEITQPLASFVARNKRFVTELKQVFKETREVQDRLDQRTYTPRELTTMEQAFAEALTTEESEDKSIEITKETR